MDVRFVDTATDRPTLLSVCFQYPDGAGGNITTTGSAASTLAAEISTRQPGSWRPSTEVTSRSAPPKCRWSREGGCWRLRAVTGRSGPPRSPVPRSLRRAPRGCSKCGSAALNEDEARRRRKIPCRGARTIPGGCRQALAAAQPRDRIVVTAGKNGAFACERGTWSTVRPCRSRGQHRGGRGCAPRRRARRARRRHAVRTPGCAAPRAFRRPLASALDLAVLLAAFEVTSPHTIHPDAHLDALIDFARRHGLEFDDNLTALGRTHGVSRMDDARDDRPPAKRATPGCGRCATRSLRCCSCSCASNTVAVPPKGSETAGQKVVGARSAEPGKSTSRCTTRVYERSGIPVSGGTATTAAATTSSRGCRDRARPQPAAERAHGHRADAAEPWRETRGPARIAGDASAAAGAGT